MISQQELLELLDYTPETGVFRWKRKPSRKIMVGEIAGYQDSDGYWHIKINGQRYFAHRLAWLYVHGELPCQIDHKNRDPLDNRLSNLRPATNSQNMANRPAMRNSKLGFRGISTRGGKYRVTLSKDGRHVFGSFDCFGKALSFARQKSIELHGEFSAHKHR